MLGFVLLITMTSGTPPAPAVLHTEFKLVQGEYSSSFDAIESFLTGGILMITLYCVSGYWFLECYRLL